MYMVASFVQTVFLELAITKLEQKGIPKERILAIPLERRANDKQILDTINHSDGVSQIDGAAVLGTIFMVLGTIYGFELKWGPVIWGLIGFITGAALGFTIDFLIRKKTYKKGKAGNSLTEVVLIINCNESQQEMVEETLWEHWSLGVARLNG